MLVPKKRGHVLVFAFVALLLLASYKQESSLLAVTAVTTALASTERSSPDMRPDNSSAASMIGGQRVIQLKRKSQHAAQKPEFLTATILPGRGMNLFQITAFLPGKGEIEVFASPSLQEVAQILDTESAEEHGVKSFTSGGAFIAPYPNRVRGRLSEDRKTITTQWNGKTLTLPVVWKGKKNPDAELHAIHGLISDHKRRHRDNDAGRPNCYGYNPWRGFRRPLAVENGSGHYDCVDGQNCRHDDYC
jgi:hypothetical protein